MNTAAAMSFVRQHGVVLVSAKGPAPRLTDAIAGEVIKGSWWAHPKSHQIFTILQQLERAPDILVCRLLAGRITMVHRRLWPAMVKLASHFQPDQLAQVRQEHTATGKHVNHIVEYPNWVPPAVLEEAESLALQEAEALLRDFIGKKPAHL
ncbi:MAG TPA: hypothetical protein VHS76_15495 [Steroidobacteraceae bacterium]|jgi:hypothetical protein|nr:hypothetical protein [Steroidobacteraceae bacterium]